MAKNAQQFKLELDEFVEEEVEGGALKLQQRIMADLLQGIILNTPVGDRRRWKLNIERKQRGLSGLLPRGYVGGHARKNWQVTINRPPTNQLPGQDNTGQETLQRGLRKITQIDKPVLAYISNRVPYIQRLEEGWSKIKPRGFVRQQIRRVSQKYKRQR